MTQTVQSTGNWQHTIQVSIPAEEVEGRLEQVARTLQRRVVLPGFRKGKVPLDRVRAEFAPHIEQEFLDGFLPEAAGRAIREAGLSPVVPPTIANLRFTPGQPLAFDAVVDVAPQVDVPDWKGLPLVRHVRPIDEAAVESVMASLRDDAAIFADLERPAQDGDVVLLDSQRLDANGRRLANTRSKGSRIQLGAPQLLPDLQNGLLGAAAGQERTITVNYPTDYSQQELAGKSVRYVVVIRKIQEKKLRELDDNFARELFHLDSLDALRDRVRHNIESEDAGRVRRELEGTALEELVRRHPFELPARLVAYMLDQVVKEQTGGREVPEDLRKQLDEHYRPGVERSLKREILLGGIARQESLAVTDEEVAADIDRMCAAEPRQAARIRARYQSSERREALREGILERKAMDAVIAAAKVKDEPIGAAVAADVAGR
jgi:trigger factor